MRKGNPVSRRTFSRDLAMTAAGLLIVANAPLAAGKPTPRQTEGPFYTDFDPGDTDLDQTLIQGHSESALGEVIYVHGQILDTRGVPLANAKVDIWQANAAGRYQHSEDENPAPLDPNFQGWGIVQTDSLGFYRYKTIKPGAYSLDSFGDSGWRARHIHYKVSHADCVPLTTQLYFPGDPLIADDEEIAEVPEADRWMMISIEEESHSSGAAIFRYDVILANRA